MCGGSIPETALMQSVFDRCIALESFTTWKANVFLVVFTFLENGLQEKSMFCEVRALSVCLSVFVFVWSISTILMEPDVYKSVPLVATPSSYFLFSCNNTVDVWASSSVGIATDYGLDGPGSNPGGDEIFRPSILALGPTQPPVKWVPVLSWG